MARALIVLKYYFNNIDIAIAALYLVLIFFTINPCC